MSTNNEDKLILGGHEFTSRFILGSGKFSLDLVKACIEKADAQIITLALRRANEGGLANILDYIPKNVTLLPNTSGARNAEEAVRIARLSREIGCGDFVNQNLDKFLSAQTFIRADRRTQRHDAGSSGIYQISGCIQIRVHIRHYYKSFFCKTFKRNRMR